MFEVGRTYHRGTDGVRERRAAGVVLFGSAGAFWGDAKRPVDFFDLKGIVEQVAASFHVSLAFAVSGCSWLRSGRRTEARSGGRVVATAGFVAPEVLQRFGVKGEVAAAEIDLEALLEATAAWKMAAVARFPGVPMILAVTHGRELEYARLLAAIRSFEVPHLHEVGLRDRFVSENEPDLVKTTMGMWYQAFDRSLTQEEVNQAHQALGTRLASLLPVTLLM